MASHQSQQHLKRPDMCMIMVLETGCSKKFRHESSIWVCRHHVAKRYTKTAYYTEPSFLVKCLNHNCLFYFISIVYMCTKQLEMRYIYLTIVTPIERSIKRYFNIKPINYSLRMWEDTNMYLCNLIFVFVNK